MPTVDDCRGTGLDGIQPVLCYACCNGDVAEGRVWEEDVKGLYACS